ncbi:hypothetical protein ACJMK2_017069, partial [Sinanodonta woodiana]
YMTPVPFTFCEILVPFGRCGRSCTLEAVHAWGIPLCEYSTSGPKCCADDSAYSGARSDESGVILTTTTTTMPVETPTALQSNQPQDIVCGNPHRPARLRRIVGGSTAPRGAWPWQVSLRFSDGQYPCAGALIGDKWIVTTAHCFKSSFNSPMFWRAYVGETELTFDSSSRQKSFEILRIIKHENFESLQQLQNDGDNTTGGSFKIRYAHDIALVELKERINILPSQQQQPICLPPSKPLNRLQEANPSTDDYLTEIERDGECWVTGWGETKDKENTEQLNRYLREVRGSVIGKSECGRQWRTSLSDFNVCFNAEGRGPCQGDSGGPLSCRFNGRFYLVGIVSWGREDCQHIGYPSVFTRMSSYIDWINRITGSNSSGTE